MNAYGFMKFFGTRRMCGAGRVVVHSRVRETPSGPPSPGQTSPKLLGHKAPDLYAGAYHLHRHFAVGIGHRLALIESRRGIWCDPAGPILALGLGVEKRLRLAYYVRSNDSLSSISRPREQTEVTLLTFSANTAYIVRLNHEGMSLASVPLGSRIFCERSSRCSMDRGQL
jgi:hypothetical protein